MTDNPDFTTEELKIVQESVNERYGHSTELQLADAEIRPDPLTRELTEVPAIFRAERDANFIIVKAGKNKFRSQFFYRGYQLFGTGHQVFDDIGLCVVTTLQVQADHETKEAK